MESQSDEPNQNNIDKSTKRLTSKSVKSTKSMNNNPFSFEANFPDISSFATNENAAAQMDAGLENTVAAKKVEVIEFNERIDLSRGRMDRIMPTSLTSYMQSFVWEKFCDEVDQAMEPTLKAEPMAQKIICLMRLILVVVILIIAVLYWDANGEISLDENDDENTPKHFYLYCALFGAFVLLICGGLTFFSCKGKILKAEGEIKQTCLTVSQTHPWLSFLVKYDPPKIFSTSQLLFEYFVLAAFFQGNIRSLCFCGSVDKVDDTTGVQMDRMCCNSNVLEQHILVTVNCTIKTSSVPATASKNTGDPVGPFVVATKASKGTVQVALEVDSASEEFDV